MPTLRGDRVLAREVEPGDGATGLLVSVRSAEEALVALAAGADLIDVKDPERGSLGRAPDSVLLSVMVAVGGRCPLSAALGELCDSPPLPPAAFLHQARFVKVGLAGCAGRENHWHAQVTALLDRIRTVEHGCRLALTAYADHQRAVAPRPIDICRFAAEHHLGGVLFDTCIKDGTSLLECLGIEELDELCRLCRSSDLAVALAGSLVAAQIEQLRRLNPDWFAVRGAACRDGARGATVEFERVRRLAALVKSRTCSKG